MQNDLISIAHCSVMRGTKVLLRDVSWTMKSGQAWLVTGPNGGGKAPFLEALAGKGTFVPLDGGYFHTVFTHTQMVSLEAAARLIQEERERDDSEYLDGGVDHGRTGAAYIAEVLDASGGFDTFSLSLCSKENTQPPVNCNDANASAIHQDNHSEAISSIIKLCGLEGVLDRGLKYMSTGEIRRTLLARALISIHCRNSKSAATLDDPDTNVCLILSDPFAGLDTQSRTLLREFFGTMVSASIHPRDRGRAGALGNPDSREAARPTVILGLERYAEVPEAITHVLEFKDGAVSYCGERAGYEARLESEAEASSGERADFTNAVKALHETEAASRYCVQPVVECFSRSEKCIETTSKQECTSPENAPIIEMNHVNVGWDGRLVLRDLSWRLLPGEHWLIRGPNGAGKTTFLELITGDNGQVYANDVKMFGRRRGTGETMWDIKARLGIVSYRLHVEYRMVGGTSLADTVVSGFRDSIGLYGAATDVERGKAMKWLRLAGFGGREGEAFSSLSYGEQRSVLILRAAVKCPQVLILDEPCHGLSEDARRMVLDLMETVAESGTTTLLHVTHEMDEVLPCEHHVLELRPGEEPMYRVVDR